jgi:hypothetical protein
LFIAKDFAGEGLLSAGGEKAVCYFLIVEWKRLETTRILSLKLKDT